MSGVTLSLTQDQAFTALRGFLLSALPEETEVIRGQVNLVPEPRGPNFVVTTEMWSERLSWNIDDEFDNIAVGSISGSTLTVSALTEGRLSPGLALIDKASAIASGTTIVKQLSGSIGGTGTYSVSKSQTVPGITFYAGERQDFTPRQWWVQLDIHGPASADNTTIIEGLFRSEVGIERIQAYGFDIAPLYCETPRQRPFVNAEQNYEYRWSIDAFLQVNPVIGTPQQFAEELDPTLIVADAEYSP